MDVFWDDKTATFKEFVSSALNGVPCLDLSFIRTDHIVDSVAGTVRTTLDCVTPVKKKRKR